MADNPAHNAPGPESDPVAAAASSAGQTEHSDEITAVDAAPSSVADHTGANAADVELVGRDTASQAHQREDVPVAVLAGAAAASSEQRRGATGAAGSRSSDPAPPSHPAAAPPDGLPVWSFRERPGRGGLDSTPPAPVDRNQVELPFARPEAVAPAEPAARPQPMFGPVGRKRSVAAVALLPVVTLGVSALAWHQRVNRELEEFDPKLHSRPLRSTVAVAVPWLIGLLATLAGSVLIVGARLSIHVPLASHVTSAEAYYLLAGLAVVPYLTLLLPFSLAAVVMTLERLRCVEEHVGTTTDRQVRAVGSSMLLVIPVIGGLVLLGTEQRRLNAIWDAVAPRGALSR